MSEAMALFEAERHRQIEVEGWTPQHDAEHEPGHLLRAAVIYLWHGTDKAAPMTENGAPLSWPWEPEWWKPKDRRSNLIRAGALCLAERAAIQLRADNAFRMRNDRVARGVSIRPAVGDRPVAHVGHVDQKLAIVIRELDALSATLSEGGDG